MIHTTEFMYLVTFNKAERAQELCRTTNGLIDINSDKDGDSLSFDTGDTGYSVDIASRQVEKGHVLPSTSRYILRDHAECRRTAKYDGSLEQAFIVGMITDQNGAPVMTFEAHKLKAGWHVSGKKFKYHVDNSVAHEVKSF